MHATKKKTENEIGRVSVSVDMCGERQGVGRIDTNKRELGHPIDHGAYGWPGAVVHKIRHPSTNETDKQNDRPTNRVTRD